MEQTKFKHKRAKVQQDIFLYNDDHDEEELRLFVGVSDKFKENNQTSNQDYFSVYNSDSN